MRKRNHNEDIEISLKIEFIEFICTIVPGIIICISVTLNMFFFLSKFYRFSPPVLLCFKTVYYKVKRVYVYLNILVI